MVAPKTIRENDYTFMQDLYGGGGDSWGWRKRRIRRGRVNLTQYLKSQEDQDMTKLLNFTRTQEKRKEGVFVCFWMKEMWVYIVVVEEIWMECHLIKVDEESWT